MPIGNDDLHMFHFSIRTQRRGRDRMVFGYTTTCAISAYQHQSCEFDSRSWRDVLDTTLCNKVCQLQVVGFLRVLRFPSPITNDCNDIA
jgi:hypothetical protein